MADTLTLADVERLEGLLKLRNSATSSVRHSDLSRELGHDMVEKAPALLSIARTVLQTREGAGEEVRELVEQLRWIGRQARNHGFSGVSLASVTKYCPEAADLLERLAARCGELEGEVERLREAEKVADEQAEDEALWAVPLEGKQAISEAYLQQELRRLHAAVEGKTPEQCARDALNKGRA